MNKTEVMVNSKDGWDGIALQKSTGAIFIRGRKVQILGIYLKTRGRM